MPNEPTSPRASDANLQLIADTPPPRLPQIEDVAAAANKREREQLELDQLRGVVRQLLQDIKQRKQYARRLYRVMVGWLTVVAYVVLAQGFGTGTPFVGAPFHVADSVLIALITTTTATVLGVFLAVANYLFPKRDQST
jgi:hypothetical protein